MSFGAFTFSLVDQLSYRPVVHIETIGRAFFQEERMLERKVIRARLDQLSYCSVVRIETIGRSFFQEERILEREIIMATEISQTAGMITSVDELKDFSHEKYVRAATRNVIEAELIYRAITDETFRNELKMNPDEVIAREFPGSFPDGKMPGGIKFQVLEEDKETRYLVLPYFGYHLSKPGLTEKELRQLAEKVACSDATYTDIACSTASGCGGTAYITVSGCTCGSWCDSVAPEM